VNPIHPFEIGKEYRRKTEIHGLYKGQAQGGISTPASFPFVFLFTSDNGEKYGYKDEYRDGVFWYTGEGQVGDMVMAKGNRAILDHVNNNKIILMFEYTKKAVVRFVGEAECIDYHEDSRPDSNGNIRKAFVFHLVMSCGVESNIVGNTEDPETKNLNKLSINELRNAALSKASRKATTAQKKYNAYYRSEAIKRYVIERSKGKCEGCAADAPFRTRIGVYLECHHLHQVADGGPDHPNNVIGLCPNCHRKSHYSVDARVYNEELKAKVERIEELLLP
jgi:5-methylcytosine-specific restriction protein A